MKQDKSHASLDVPINLHPNDCTRVRTSSWIRKSRSQGGKKSESMQSRVNLSRAITTSWTKRGQEKTPVLLRATTSSKKRYIDDVKQDKSHASLDVPINLHPNDCTRVRTSSWIRKSRSQGGKKSESMQSRVNLSRAITTSWTKRGQEKNPVLLRATTSSKKRYIDDVMCKK